MTIHTAHPSSREHGLADGCPRCAEHAKRPLASLDRDHIDDLWKRMCAVEFDPFGTHDLHYRSETEAAAGHVLVEHAILLQSIGIPPASVSPGRPYVPAGARPEGVLFAEIIEQVEHDEYAIVVASTDDTQQRFTVSLSYGGDANPDGGDVGRTQFVGGASLPYILGTIVDTLRQEHRA